MKDLYQQFRDSHFPREGPDFTIIENARGEERKQLEEKLIENLEYYDPAALAILKSTDAVPHLKKALLTSTGGMKTQIAKALWDIEQFPNAVKEIASVLFADSEHRPHNGALAAVLALRGINTPESSEVLGKAIFDADDLIRYNAARVMAFNNQKEISSTSISEAVKFGSKERINELKQWLES